MQTAEKHTFSFLTSKVRHENLHNAMLFFFHQPDWQRKTSSVVENVGNNIEKIPANGACSYLGHKIHFVTVSSYLIHRSQAIEGSSYWRGLQKLLKEEVSVAKL